VIRNALVALALLAAVACGKYGPPVRSASTRAATPAAATPAVSAAPAPDDTEQCADPNAPAQAAGTTP
jgi:hypothetical protein